MNGKQGDDPVFDIVHYGLPVYSPEVDNLVKELVKLMNFRRTQELMESLRELSIDELKLKLTSILQKLRIKAKNSGWEID